MEDTRPRASFVQRLRRWFPWIAGLAIVGLIISRVPFDAFRSAIAHGPHVTLAGVDLLITVVVLATDATSTWVGLVGLRMRRPLVAVLAVRGATYLLFLLNYAVGQGGFGYYLYRTGASGLRSTGATLFLIGTNLATLMLVTTVSFALYGPATLNHTMWWTLQIGCFAFAAYLVVIAIAPRFVARREIFAPLFDAGVRGHAIAIVGRLPHVLVITFGHWVAMRAWGIEAPFAIGFAVMPAVVIASVLPISPAGLGTAQAAIVYFFADYAPGATADARSANILAYGIVHFVYGVLASLLVGLICAPIARRIMPPKEDR